MNTLPKNVFYDLHIFEFFLYRHNLKFKIYLTLSQKMLKRTFETKKVHFENNRTSVIEITDSILFWNDFPVKAMQYISFIPFTSSKEYEHEYFTEECILSISDIGILFPDVI